MLGRAVAVLDDNAEHCDFGIITGSEKAHKLLILPHVVVHVVLVCLSDALHDVAIVVAEADPSDILSIEEEPHFVNFSFSLKHFCLTLPTVRSNSVKWDRRSQLFVQVSDLNGVELTLLVNTGVEFVEDATLGHVLGDEGSRVDQRVLLRVLSDVNRPAQALLSQITLIVVGGGDQNRWALHHCSGQGQGQ